MTLTQQRLQELLDYNPQTGVFVWLTPQKRRRAGDRAGCTHHSGCRLIGIDRVLYQEHRLAWLWMTGEWPSGQVDHKDRDRANNSWANLRVATASQNRANSKVNSNSCTGIKGAQYFPRYRKYAALIKKDGKKKWLGWFDTAEAAHARYMREARKLHGEFARAAG